MASLYYIFLIVSLSSLSSVSSQFNCQTLKDAFGVTRKFKSQNINIDKIRLYSYASGESYDMETAARDILASDTLDMNQDFYVWIHGWMSKMTGSMGITDALLKKGYKNVFALDTTAYTDTINYVESSSYAAPIGNKLAEVLIDLTKLADLKSKRIHLLGHSLGAQIAGFTGKAYFEAIGEKIERISAMDPAGPCFASYPDNLKLTENDAVFVDVIHTNHGILGINAPCGSVDFFVNGGKYQAGCGLNPSCSHGRAMEFFAESIIEPQAFPAVKAESWTDFKSKKPNREMRYMGFGAKPEGTKGTYHLRTNTKSAFSLGMNGIVMA